MGFCRIRYTNNQLWSLRHLGDHMEREGVMSTQAKKCGNAACTCKVTDSKSKFCSAHCEGMAGRVELMCTCGHAECGVTESIAAPVEPVQSPSQPPTT